MKYTDKLMINIIAVTIITISAMAIFGISADINWLFTWSKTSMALNTAIEFAFTGIGLILLNHKKNNE